MTKKLTLSMDEKTIMKAKFISKQKGSSVSQMVQTFFNEFDEKGSKNIYKVEAMSGILKDKVPADFDLKKFKQEYLAKKHGL